MDDDELLTNILNYHRLRKEREEEEEFCLETFVT